MGVQDVVARLNKSKSASNTSKSPNGQALKKKIIMPSSHESNKFPPSPIPSPTSTMHSHTNQSASNSSNNAISGSGNIASMLQKFGQPTQSLSKQSKPVPQSTVSSPQPQQKQQQPKLPTPPESPVNSLQQNQRPQQRKIAVAPMNRNNDPYIKFDTAADELISLFQSLLDKNAAHEEYIKKLEQEVEHHVSAATKVRDYEIRVEYLALKLEQVSEERDYFEKELNELADKSSRQSDSSANSSSSSIAKSSSDLDERHFESRQNMTEEEERLQKQNNDAYIADILNVYEEMSIKEDETAQEHLEQQLIEYDKGVQMAIASYVSNLEAERLETKNLQEIVLKQDELITKLEQKLEESSDELLKEQVEVQRIELENKRELLAQLLNEREDLLRRLNSRKRRSSIELISNMLQSDIVINTNNHRNSCSSSSSKISNRGTPPLTAPPKQPLPPLPAAT
ncbi:hypothetical protein EDC96DRAFT_493936 [Choanephora cucurbitarum]|nr:hypothetical protein EDC96DRAFT_493936 [Choanephora cucurbitarum]